MYLIYGELQLDRSSLFAGWLSFSCWRSDVSFAEMADTGGAEAPMPRAVRLSHDNKRCAGFRLCVTFLSIVQTPVALPNYLPSCHKPRRKTLLWSWCADDCMIDTARNMRRAMRSRYSSHLGKKKRKQLQPLHLVVGACHMPPLSTVL